MLTRCLDQHPVENSLEAATRKKKSKHQAEVDHQQAANSLETATNIQTNKTLSWSVV